MSLAATEKQAHAPTQETSLRVAYLVSRFPKLTETFVLYEILALQELGIDVKLFPLQRERTKIMHAEAQAVVDSARFTPFLLSWSLLRAHLHFIYSRPGTYFGTLCTLLRANFGSSRYLKGAIAFFPKACLLAWKLQQLGVQHLHAHFASHPAAVAYVINRLTGIRFSFTAHGSDLHCDRHMLRQKVDAADFVVTISDYNRDVIRQECGDECLDKVRVIHCGVDTAKFLFRQEETAFDRGAGPFKIVCTGTLHEVKGQEHLLAACHSLREQGLDFECHLVGDGPDLKPLQQQASKLAISERVFFHGRLPHHAVNEVLESADLLVAPSVPTDSGRREGIPVALMEAMSSGVTVVASELSGIPELVEHETTGLLVEPRDVSGLAEALERLYHDRELRRRLAAQARDKVECEFDLQQNALQLAHCFQNGGKL